MKTFICANHSYNPSTKTVKCDYPRETTDTIDNPLRSSDGAAAVGAGAGGVAVSTTKYKKLYNKYKRKYINLKRQLNM